MARTKTNIPAPDLGAVQRSWMGKFVRDAMENTLGFVHDVRETEEGIRLLARFPGEKTDRQIAIEPGQGCDYLTPEDPKARYRPPKAEDLERLKKLAAARG